MGRDELQQILDSIHAVDNRLARLEERTHQLPDRLLAVERWKERMVGVSMAVGAVSSLITGVLLWALTKMFN